VGERLLDIVGDAGEVGIKGGADVAEDRLAGTFGSGVEGNDAVGLVDPVGVLVFGRAPGASGDGFDPLDL